MTPPRATRAARAAVAGAEAGVVAHPVTPRAPSRPRAQGPTPTAPLTLTRARVAAHRPDVAAGVAAAARTRASIPRIPSARPSMSASPARATTRRLHSRVRCDSKLSDSAAARAVMPGDVVPRFSPRPSSSRVASRWTASWSSVSRRVAPRSPCSKTAYSSSTMWIAAPPTRWSATSTSVACKTSCLPWRLPSSTSGADATPFSMPAKSIGMPPASRASRDVSRWH